MIARHRLQPGGTSTVRPSTTGPRKRRQKQPITYDDDDVTDSLAPEEENILRRSRRDWYSNCYQSFEKAQIQRDAIGKVVQTKAEDGQTYTNYVFKCKVCGKFVTRHSGSKTMSNLVKHAKICNVGDDVRSQQLMSGFSSGSKLSGSHTGHNLACVTEKCLKEFDVENRPLQLLMFVSDNATNNDTLATSLERRLCGVGLFRGRRHRVWHFCVRFSEEEKGKQWGHGSEAEWDELADEVNRYASMRRRRRRRRRRNGNGNDENREGEGDDRIDTDMDKEQEDADEVAVDQFEDTAEKGELDSVDLALLPITVAERREACVLLSKVQNSGRYRDALKQKAEEEGVPSRALVKVVLTRWNSHAMCLL
ncbi:hypothetical protein EDB84DRAFT_1435860 [Lactarius hengduanensis]|nr:hypothetical protein EDB84DRAFT_1435860 [Lactarius hengduanensis]